MCNFDCNLSTFWISNESCQFRDPSSPFSDRNALHCLNVPLCIGCGSSYKCYSRMMRFHFFEIRMITFHAPHYHFIQWLLMNRILWNINNAISNQVPSQVLPQICSNTRLFTKNCKFHSMTGYPMRCIHITHLEVFIFCLKTQSSWIRYRKISQQISPVCSVYRLQIKDCENSNAFSGSDIAS